MNKPKKGQMIKIKTDQDLDGAGCSILTEIVFGEMAESQHCNNKTINQYVEKFLEKKKNENVFLIITDMATNKENEIKLEKRHQEKQNVLLIDHHEKTLYFNAYEWAVVQTEDENGIKVCATSLLYEFFKKEKFIIPTQALDEFVELIRLYDTWDWFKKKTYKAKQLNDLLYMKGMQDFKESMKIRILQNPSEIYFEQEEQTFLDLEQRKIDSFINLKERQLITDWKRGKKVGIVHTEQYHSELGNELGCRHPYLDLIVLVNAGNKKVSYRTIHSTIDVNEYAGNYGGGGHTEASGSELNEEAFHDFVISVFSLKPRPKEPELNKYNQKQSKYGTVYENMNEQKYYIYPKNNRWNMIHLQSENETVYSFETFQEAEYFAKREFDVYLSRDDEFIKMVVEKHDVKEAKLRSQFEQTMNALSFED